MMIITQLREMLGEDAVGLQDRDVVALAAVRATEEIVSSVGNVPGVVGESHHDVVAASIKTMLAHSRKKINPVPVRRVITVRISAECCGKLWSNDDPKSAIEDIIESAMDRGTSNSQGIEMTLDELTVQ